VQPPNTPVPSPTVLVVTRRLEVLDTVLPLLNQHGLPQVLATRDTAEALARIRHFPVERLWLDADLPQAAALLSGALEHTNGTPARPPSAVLLKDGQPQDHLAWVALGVSEFVEAPLSPGVFEARWVAWLREREVLWQRFQGMALADVETGLPNQGAGVAALVRAQASALRAGYPLTVVAWAVPASALPAMAEHLQHNIRTEDLLVRWAADRLVLVLPRSSLVDTARLVERLFKNLPGPHADQAAGVAALSPQTKDLGLMAQAEEALAAALRAGPGAVAMASAGGPRVLPPTRRT
jgi:PleD family two-component response regulator